MQIWHRRQRQREARVILERADAALAEHHLCVARFQNVFGGEQELIHRRRWAALEQDRQIRFADRFEQWVVLHVAGADLQHVGILRYQLDVLRRHYLRDDGQPGLGAGLGQELQTLLLQSLEAVWAGARLECAATKTRGTCLLYDMGDFQDLLPVFDGTGPGNDADPAAANLQLQDFHDRPFLLYFGAGHLVRGQDRDHFLHPLSGFEGLLGAVALFAECGDDGPLGADDHMAAQTQLLDPLDNVIDLPLRGPGLHDDDHGRTPLPARSASEGDKSPRLRVGLGWSSNKKPPEPRGFQGLNRCPYRPLTTGRPPGIPLTRGQKTSTSTQTHRQRRWQRIVGKNAESRLSSGDKGNPGEIRAGAP